MTQFVKFRLVHLIFTGQTNHVDMVYTASITLFSRSSYLWSYSYIRRITNFPIHLGPVCHIIRQKNQFLFILISDH